MMYNFKCQNIPMSRDIAVSSWDGLFSNLYYSHSLLCTMHAKFTNDIRIKNYYRNSLKT